MIQMYTFLDVADNTGAKEVMCIQVLGGSKRRVAYLGDVIKASVKKALPGGDVKPGDVAKGVIVRTRVATRREDGSYVRFDRNALVLLDNDNNPRAPASSGRSRGSCGRSSTRSSASPPRWLSVSSVRGGCGGTKPCTSAKTTSSRS